MSSASRVPEVATRSTGPAADEPTAVDAHETLRRVGTWPLLRASVARFRAGDGTSSTRALALQSALAVVPLGIAVMGLAALLRSDLGRVLESTVLALTPGASDEMVRQALEQGSDARGAAGLVAVVGGLLVALASGTSAMALVERGANRIYGIQRDRPFRERYALAALLTVTAGLPLLLGFLGLVAGGAFLDGWAAAYGDGPLLDALRLLRVPASALLVLVAATAVLRRAPARCQPSWSWLSLAAGVLLVLWLAGTGLLAVYVTTAGDGGTRYGPLIGIVALLLWAEITSGALFAGIAVAAQLEAEAAGVPVRAEPLDGAAA